MSHGFLCGKKMIRTLFAEILGIAFYILAVQTQAFREFSDGA
jgi:hypothetical protein